MELNVELDFEAWLEQGVKNGWCGPAVCYTHDGMPTTEPEDTEFEDGGDPCIHVVRMYEDRIHKMGVEANHSPSTWRATNRGIGI